MFSYICPKGVYNFFLMPCYNLLTGLPEPSPKKGGYNMAYTCPLMSSATNKVDCTTQCALFIREGRNATCSINIAALHILEIEKKVDLISRNNRR